MTGEGRPLLAVIVCTRERPARLRRTLETLAGAHPPEVEWELLVVETSSGDDTARVSALLRDGRLDEAARVAEAWAGRSPEAPDAWRLVSLVAQRAGDFERMLEAAEAAHAAAPADPGAEFRLLECRLYCGQADRVIARLRELERGGRDDAPLLCRVAEYYAHCARHADAHRCYERAVELAPDNPDYLFSLAASQIALGLLDAAEATLGRVIELNPHDYDAWRNRATLRRWTRDENHVAEIEAMLERGVQRPAGEAQLGYALAKELEDLGDDEASFRALERGAGARRRLMRYRVETDLEAIERIRETYTADWLASQPRGCPGTGPVFVIGLPRSGTTLVDRILGSHSRVASLGEINDFAYALMRTAGSAASKLELISSAAGAEPARLGRYYLDSTRAYGVAADYLVDKTPLNYLYVGLICAALPDARIVHLARAPLDACYGMYRTLFRAGYPFSYDLDDLARYYIAYHGLMQHWRQEFPDALLDVRYEDLVEDQEGVSRRIVGYCGLPWEPECLDFHRNRAPVATASSAQVRRPVYRDALARWRRYERQLAPLAERLEAAGIDTGRNR